MKPNIEYDKKIAKKFHDVSYYKSEQFTKKNISLMEQEKNRLKTTDKDKVTKKIKSLLNTVGEKDQVFLILEKIYKKNQDYAFGKSKEEPINTDLLNLLSDVSLLMTSYNKVRRNRGAMTEASEMSGNNYKNLNAEEKSWVNKTTNCPDGINKEVFEITSKLIKQNKYPWGTSRRIYVDKPGKKDVKRPITIPPFMDRIVQEALTTILTTIYEPYFEVHNCSFGFRPNKGVHDAIVSLTNQDTAGLNMALEGDIKAAYDKVLKSKCIEILGKRIHDRKLLNFIKKRLDYEYWDTKENKYMRPEEGLPQGGIDSPYLWNIYMSIFDEFITNSLTEYTNKLNEEKRGNNKRRGIISKEKRIIERKRTTIRNILNSLQKYKEQEQLERLKYIASKSVKVLNEEGVLKGELAGLKEILKLSGIGKIDDIRLIKTNLERKSKELATEGIKIPSRNLNKLKLRFKYVRYADDWIILTNMKKYMLEKWKENINKFLKEELGATLSIEKTLLTDIREKSAHFLGFEIKTYKNKKIGRYRKFINGKLINIKAITAGSKVFAIPDRQRLIDRLHMKGYSDKHSKPKEIGFLTNLDDFIIIERYNSVLNGIALYYTEFIRNAKRNLSRWIYIIRYSCIKTLAHKHKTTVRGIFKKYVAKKTKDQKSRENTIQVTVRNKIGEDTYSKDWTLLTLDKLISNALSLKRRKILYDRYHTLKNKKPITYTGSDKKSITNDKFYDKLMWINIRTSSAFDLPCCICGSEKEIEMHHIKNVKKNRYDLIDKEMTWKQAMYIRNRKQIPVCKECHINLIHGGRYSGGTKYSYMAPKIMYDNRIITIEGHINKRVLNGDKVSFSKTLEEKGWIKEKES